MWFAKRNIVFFALSVLLSATGLLAQEDIDCIEYSGDPDPRCAYVRIDAPTGGGLFVVAEGKDVISANALPNADFFVYLPKASSDSIKATVIADGSKVEHMKKVNSGTERVVLTSVEGLYPIYNVAMGTAASEDGYVNIARVYNFYAPGVEFCLDQKCKEPITNKTKLQLEVGDSLIVYARLYIPVGPDAGVTDSTLVEKDFYIRPLAEGENLRYYTLSGTELPKGELGYQIIFHNGKAVFVICATKAVVQGPPFTINGYEDPSAEGGDPEFIVSQEFPGDLQFVNPDMPVPDSAFIYDTNGDGAGDSIVAFFSGRMDSVAMESFAYNWPDGGKFKDHQGDWTWDPKKGILELTGVKVSIPKEVGEGKLSVTMSSVNTGKEAEAQSELNDRIGPVILEANLIKGAGATDTLELFFNKDIDTSWTKGKGYILNGSPVNLEAIEKDGKHWFFVIDTGVVDFGDSIQIATTCAKKACPDGLVKAADGNETGKNKPAIVQNSGRIYVDDEKNAFFDRNGDGRMDSASIAFDMPITREDLEKMTIRYYWLDTDGKLLEIVPDPSKLTLSEDGTVVGFALKEDKYGIKEKLTSIDQSYSKDGAEYGYVSVSYFETVDGETTEKTMNLAMHDRMAPVISGTFLEPESYQKMAADVFRIDFSEAIDYKNMSTDDLAEVLRFYVDGEWVKLPFTSVSWSSDGKTAEIRMENGTRLVDRMNPTDSVKFDLAGVNFVDKEGNGVSGKAPAEMVEGDPRVIMQNYSFASRRDIDEKADDAITFEVADNLTSEEARKALGVLMDVSFSTILKDDGADDIEMDLSKIGMEWEMEVYTNLGGFVARKSLKIKCNDREIFDGNCFENPHQLYLRWNMLADNGRRVGVGAYVAHIKARVYGAKESFKVERFYNWGITGSRKIRSSEKK